jgi:hypothetical protein
MDGRPDMNPLPKAVGQLRRLARHRPEEGHPEAEDASVGGDLEVAATWSGRHPYDGLVQVLAGRRNQKWSISEAEESSVGSDLVIAPARPAWMPTIGACNDRLLIES